MAVQHESVPGGRPSHPRDEIDRRRLAHHPPVLDADPAVQHGLDRLDHRGGVARRIGAVDAHQPPAQLDELRRPRLDARRKTRLHAARAQSSPSVAARSARDTVESVVERTNTPRAGALMVSTSSP